MKKLSYLLFALFMGFWGQSCSNDDPQTGQPEIDMDSRALVEFKITGMDAGKVNTRAAGNDGPIINDRPTLEKLVKDMRILVLTPAGVCLTYSDIDPSMVHEDNIIQISAPIGTLDFILLTNVTNDSIMPKASLIGKSKTEIIAMLKDHKAYADPNYFVQAPELFIFHAKDISVISDPDFNAGQNVVNNVVMKRLVSKLETTVYKENVYNDATSTTQHPAYVTSIDTIILRHVSPDVNMVHMLDNRAPLFSAAKARIADHVWDISTPATPVNKLLSFSTEALGVKPFVIIGAEVNTADAYYTADPNEITGPTGKPMRYWGLQLENNYLRENVRLLLTINKLLGPGHITPPEPNVLGDVQFVITFVDWDNTPDTESGNGQ